MRLMKSKQRRRPVRRGLNRDDIVTLYEGGFTMREVARLLDPKNPPSESTVRWHLVQSGIPLRTFRDYEYSKVPQKELEAMIFMYQKLEISTVDIGKHFHIHPDAVRKRLRKVGALRTKSEALELAWRQGKKGKRRKKLTASSGAC